MSFNSMAVNLKISRLEVCDLLVATTSIVHGMKDEANDPNTSDTRRKILNSSIPKWEKLNNKIREQLDAFDEKHLEA